MATTSILSWLFCLTLYVALELKNDQQVKQNKCYKRYFYQGRAEIQKEEKQKNPETKQAQLSCLFMAKLHIIVLL